MMMVKHIILWQLREELSAEEKQKVKAEIKEGLEGLQGTVPGLLEIHVQTEALLSSNADLMLDAGFEDEAALKGYAVHPAHVAVADAKVRPFTKTRICLDFEQE
jgi:putative aminopeptidase FrvX